MSRAKKSKFTKAERAEVVFALKAVAVELAEYWDVLRKLETKYGIEINTDSGELLSSIAGSCSIPPAHSDLNDMDIWETFKEAFNDGQR